MRTYFSSPATASQPATADVTMPTIIGTSEPVGDAVDGELADLEHRGAAVTGMAIRNEIRAADSRVNVQDAGGGDRDARAGRARVERQHLGGADDRRRRAGPCRRSPACRAARSAQPSRRPKKIERDGDEGDAARAARRSGFSNSGADEGGRQRGQEQEPRRAARWWSTRGPECAAPASPRGRTRRGRGGSSTHTATSVPMCSATSNAFCTLSLSKSFQPNSQGTTIRWPDDEIGRNSDSPWTRPRMMAWMMGMVLGSPVRTGQLRCWARCGAARGGAASKWWPTTVAASQSGEERRGVRRSRASRRRRHRVASGTWASLPAPAASPRSAAKPPPAR